MVLGFCVGILENEVNNVFIVARVEIKCTSCLLYDLCSQRVNIKPKSTNQIAPLSL